jgi:hypothetical protein
MGVGDWLKGAWGKVKNVATKVGGTMLKGVKAVGRGVKKVATKVYENRGKILNVGSKVLKYGGAATALVPGMQGVGAGLATAGAVVGKLKDHIG